MKPIFKTLLSKSSIVAASLLLICNVSFAGHHEKGEEKSEQEVSTSFNLSELTCWDVMTLEEADRDTVLFLFYGYVSGVKGELEHDGKTMTKILSQLGTHCSENPDDMILELMTKSN